MPLTDRDRAGEMQRNPSQGNACSGQHVRWWGYSRWPTYGARGLVWYCTGISLAVSLCCLMIPSPWTPVPAALLVFVWLWGRTSAVAVGLDDEHLYVRRLFLGRVERIPISEIRRCLVLRGLLRTRLRIYGGRPPWLTMTHGSVLLGFTVRDWEGLLESLGGIFRPVGKWEELDHWWY